MSTLSEKLEYLEETKSQIKQAIINKGVEVESNDTFRSYAEKINGITTSSSDTEEINAYVPDTYTNNITIGDTLLINPTTDYTDQFLTFNYNNNEQPWAEYETDTSKQYINKVIATKNILITNYYFSHDLFTFTKSPNETTFNTNYNVEDAYKSRFVNLFVKENTLFIYPSNTYTNIRCVSMDFDTNEITSTQLSYSNMYYTPTFNNMFSTIYCLEDNLLYSFATITGKLHILNIDTFETQVAVINTASEGVNGVIGMRIHNGYIYLLRVKLTILKINLSDLNNISDVTSYSLSTNLDYNNMSTFSVLSAGQLFNGLYTFMYDNSYSSRVLKSIINDDGDIEWIDDTANTTLIRSKLGFCIYNTPITFCPQTDNSIYIQSKDKFIAFQYDADTDSLIEIDNPCANLINDDDYQVYYASYNKLENVACIVACPTQGIYEVRLMEVPPINLSNYDYMVCEKTGDNLNDASFIAPVIDNGDVDSDNIPYTVVKVFKDSTVIEENT